MRRLFLPVIILLSFTIPAAAGINIDCGRQLFIDDYLIQSTDLSRVWHYPVKYENNPVLVPQTAWECPEGGNPTARPNGGGIWWDAQEKVFKLWYEGGWLHSVCYATSKDGINWERPQLDIVEGTNIVLPMDNPAFRPDSWSVVVDPDAKKPEEKYKMMLHRPWTGEKATPDGACFVSADGIHWKPIYSLPASGDRSTMYYDPFREKWVFSIRSSWLKEGDTHRLRNRSYVAVDDFTEIPQWYAYGKPYDYWTENYSAEPWLAADSLDLPDPEVSAKFRTGLYNFDAVAYESIMLGMMEIHLGPENQDCEPFGMPKVTDLKFAYSRDGKNYIRPDRNAAIAAERWASGKWDAGYVQPVSNLCVIMGDELWFYYGAFAGEPSRPSTPEHPRDWTVDSGMYANASTGIAKLRRDGFASMEGSGSLVTKGLTASGEYFFINADASKGAISVELLDPEGKVVEGYSAADSKVKKINSTKYRVCWKKHDRIPMAKFRGYSLRFVLDNAALYSFWISMEENGPSNGYLAGGGPGYAGLKDTYSKQRPQICAVIAPPDEYHSKENRLHQGIPSIAASPSGRLWATWYCSRTTQEDYTNYVVLATCAKDGEPWNEVLICDPDNDGPRRSFDPEIWLSPDGKLRWSWTDRKGDVFSLPDDDQLWMATLDAESGKMLEEPRVIARGVMMNKPTVLSDGTWILPVAHWQDNPSACVYASKDCGKTFEYRGGARVPKEYREFEEHTILQKKDGSLKVYIRLANYGDCHHNGLWEAESFDEGYTWTPARPCPVANLTSRTFVTKLSSGEWLMVKHGSYSRVLNTRSHLTALISYDEGHSWWGGLEIDERDGCSYPNGVQLPDGSVVVISDFDRVGAQEISYVKFRPEDIIKGVNKPQRRIISRH